MGVRLHFTVLKHKCISISDCPKEWYEIYFVFACVWAFGAAMFHDQVQKCICYCIKHSVHFGGYLNVIEKLKVSIWHAFGIQS